MRLTAITITNSMIFFAWASIQFVSLVLFGYVSYDFRGMYTLLTSSNYCHMSVHPQPALV